MIFCRWLSNADPAATTHFVLVKVTKMVPPPSLTSCSVAPSPIVPVIAADSVLAVMVVVGVAVTAPPPFNAVDGTVVVITSLVAM